LQKCNGDCCGNDVIFKPQELKAIESIVNLKKYKKEAINDGYRLSTRGIKNEKCVFLKNGKCSVYSVRPEICKDYGERVYIQCPYNGLKEIPSNPDERYNLTIKVQKVFYDKIEELFGYKPNLIPFTAKNVFNK